MTFASAARGQAPSLECPLPGQPDQRFSVDLPRIAVPRSVPQFEPVAFFADCLAGLSQPQKSLPCKWLYDAAGSRLFEQICGVPEYYPSRAEMRLIVEALPLLSDLITPGTTLIELGSGASRKTRTLLDALSGITAYVPIDISATELESAVRKIRSDYRGLEVRPLCADFSALGDLGLSRIEGPVLAFFPGSTIGNMAPDEATAFLEGLRRTLPAGAALMLGIDVVKDLKVLVAAYDDAAGVTAAFNRNILARINCELGGEIDVDAFDHQARWNAGESRIEMHLVATRNQLLPIGSTVFSIAAGESIHTENSYKPAVSQSIAIFENAGWTVAQSWTADEPSYLLCLLKPAEEL